MRPKLFLSKSKILRNLRLLKHYPCLTIGFIILKMFRYIGFSIKKEVNTESEKMHLKKEKKSLGWAIGKRKYLITLFGVSCFPIIVNEETSNIINFYFLRNDEIVNKLLKITKEKIDIVKKPKVFEPGCNCGKMLFKIKDELGAEICGADLFAPSIAFAQKIADKEDKFYATDLVKTNFLQQYKNENFDFIFISSHLVHVLHFDEFQNYFSSLRRISKNILIHEKYDQFLFDFLKNNKPIYLISTEKDIICLM